MNLEQWLTANGLENYIDIFRQNDIGVDVLTQLTEEDLKEMGFPIGACRRFLTAVNPEGHSPAPQPSSEQPGVQPALQPAAPQSTAQQPAAPADPQQVEFQPANQPVQTTQPAIQQAPHLAPSAQAHAVKAIRHQPKAKNSRKATAIMIAVGVHVGIILLATTLTIFAASKDEPELVASIAPPSTSPQQEMKKKTVQKQVKRAPSAASAAAAPMAIMMKANAEARFTTPDVTRTSTGPLGMGEGDVGAGAFGVGTGLGAGAGSGGSFFGSKVQGNLAVVFDITKSMYSANPIVIAEVKRSFKDAHVVCVYGAGFKDNPAKFVRYKSNDGVLAQVKSASEKIGAVAVGKAMNEALFSLRRCDSLARSRQFALQSLGTAIENLLNQKDRPGTIYVFSDFKDGIEPAYMNKVQQLVKQHGTKVVFWNPTRWQKGQVEDRALYEAFAKATRGEVKAGGLEK